MLATRRKKLNIIKYYIKFGANPSIQDSTGYSPVMIAAINGYIEIFLELITVDQSFNYRSELDGMTPFLAACNSCDKDIVKALFEKEKGVCLDEVDNQNNNCLHHVLKQEMKRDSFLFLADILGDKLTTLFISKNKYSESPLDTIIRRKDHKMMQRLVSSHPELAGYLTASLIVTFKAEDQEMCLICREEFVEIDRVTKLPCKHLYHEDCFNEWAEMNRICPYCRRDPFQN